VGVERTRSVRSGRYASNNSAGLSHVAYYLALDRRRSNYCTRVKWASSVTNSLLW
jgi:hypothetical protein